MLITCLKLTVVKKYLILSLLIYKLYSNTVFKYQMICSICEYLWFLIFLLAYPHGVTTYDLASVICHHGTAGCKQHCACI